MFPSWVLWASAGVCCLPGTIGILWFVLKLGPARQRRGGWRVSARLEPRHLGVGVHWTWKADEFRVYAYPLPGVVIQATRETLPAPFKGWPSGLGLPPAPPAPGFCTACGRGDGGHSDWCCGLPPIDLSGIPEAPKPPYRTGPFRDDGYCEDCPWGNENDVRRGVRCGSCNRLVEMPPIHHNDKGNN